MINPGAREWLIARAIEAAPFEACGFILENGAIIEVNNISLTPAKSFKMCHVDATEKLSGTLAFVTGIWHTHPRGTEHPSLTDLDAITLGAVQRNWDYYIVTAAGVFQYDTGLYAPLDHKLWEQFHSDTAAS